MGTLVSLIFLYIIEKSKALKYFIVFIFSFSVFLLLLGIIVYLEIHSIKLSDFLSIFTLIIGQMVFFFVIYSVFLLIKVIFNINYNLKVKITVFLISIYPVILGIIFISIFSIKLIELKLYKFLDASISFTILFLYLFLVLNPKKFYKKLKNPNVKKYVLYYYVIYGIVILTIAINDIIKITFNLVYTEYEFVMLPFFFLIQNAIIIKFSISHYRKTHIKVSFTNIPLGLVEKYDITKREEQVINLILHGYKNKEIAGLLALTSGTVKGYIHKIYRKIGVESRVQLVKKITEYK